MIYLRNGRGIVEIEESNNNNIQSIIPPDSDEALTPHEQEEHAMDSGQQLQQQHHQQHGRDDIMETEQEEQHQEESEEQKQGEGEDLTHHESILEQRRHEQEGDGEGEDESDLEHSSQTVLAQAVLSPPIAAATNAANAARHRAVIAASEAALTAAAGDFLVRSDGTLRRQTSLHNDDDDDDEDDDEEDYFLEGIFFHRDDDGGAGGAGDSNDLDTNSSHLDSMGGHEHSLDSIHSREGSNSNNQYSDRGNANNKSDEENQALFEKMESFLCRFETLTEFYHTLQRLEVEDESDTDHEEDDFVKDDDLEYVRLFFQLDDEDEEEMNDANLSNLENNNHSNIGNDNSKKNDSNSKKELCHPRDIFTGDEGSPLIGRCGSGHDKFSTEHDSAVKAAARESAGFGGGIQDMEFSEYVTNQTTLQNNTDTENGKAEISPPPIPPPLPLEQLMKILFRPGMKYCGKIQIPGLGQPRGDDATDNNTIEKENNDYELIIEWNQSDTLGNQYLSARHRAYDDEQYVHLRVDIKLDASLSSSTTGNNDIEHEAIHIEYADGETVCKGFWNPLRFRFEGKVYQMMQANNKVYYSNAVSHVFTLYPCTANHRRGWGNSRRYRRRSDDNNDPTNSPNWRETMMQDLLSVDTRSIAAHRHRTNKLQMELLLQFDDVDNAMELDPSAKRRMRLLLHSDAVPSPSALPNDRGVHIFHFFRRLRDMEWSLLISGTSLWGEYTCAEFRRRAALYDDTTFKTRGEKEEIIKKWKETGMDLSGAHELWNNWETAVKRAGLLQFFGTSSRSISSMMYPFHVMSTRLYGNYDFLEHAYRRAEGRLPREDLKKFEIASSFKDFLDGNEGEVTKGEEGATCAICQEFLFGEDLEEKRRTTTENKAKETLYKLACSHCFHSQCLSDWLHDNSSCPVCRYDVAA